MSGLSADVIRLQSHVMRRALGIPSHDVVHPNVDDARFNDPAWTTSASWDILKESADSEFDLFQTVDRRRIKR